MKRELLFDLDDAVVVEEPAAVAAFYATAQVAVTRHPVDAERLALPARERARRRRVRSDSLFADRRLDASLFKQAREVVAQLPRPRF